MFKRFADEKHREQAEGFLLSLGKFVLAFEQVCTAMRHLVMFILRNQGLKNAGMEQVIIGNRRAAELRELLGALYAELSGQDEDDRKVVQDLLQSIETVTSKRNILVHGDWHLGREAAEGEFMTGSLRFRAKRNDGAIIEQHVASSSYVDDLTQQAETCQILLQRLQYCICQTGFKVAVELRKPL